MEFLVLPSESPQVWARIETILRTPLNELKELDSLLNQFSTTDQRSSFFTEVPLQQEASNFDFVDFWQSGFPLMLELALEMPQLFANTRVPLLLAGINASVELSHRQCACLLAHSAFGSITAEARQVKKEKWAFRAAQLFFLQAIPSALCFLNYFRRLGHTGVPEGLVTFERRSFSKRNPPWSWPDSSKPLCPVEILPTGSIADSPADYHVDFANRFVGGGCLENDFMMEEILFVTHPELIVSMALCSYMQDEEAILISGASCYSSHSGYGHSFAFEGDSPATDRALPPTIVALDAIQGMSKIQFQEGILLRDLNKARLGFAGARTLATGNWGCGAFGNDHLLKFLQQWLAASDAGVERLLYYNFADKRTAGFPDLVTALVGTPVRELFEKVLAAASTVTPGPAAGANFRSALLAAAKVQL